jgi:hypothetical protein
MTKKISTLMRLAPLLAVISTYAHAENAIRVKVPFPFVTAGKTLPAADYRVQFRRDNGTVTLSAPGIASATMLTNAGQRPGGKKPSLQFRRSGDNWVLQGINLDDTTQVVTASGSRKEVSKVQASCEEIATAADSSSD